MRRALAAAVALLGALFCVQPAVAAPGDLVSAAPMTAFVTPGVPMPGTAWKITYRSTTALGQPTEVTGTVLIPDGPADPMRPLLGYAIGSQGLADRCAPSKQLADGSEYEAGAIRAMLDRGWVVSLTDYPGLGTPGDHTYVVGKANGRATLDSMRAARHLPQAGLAADGPLALFGYSEGGGATGAAVEQQPIYAPDLPLKGAAVGGVVADFDASLKHVEGGPAAFLVMYAAIGFNAAYPELALDRYLNARGKAYVAQLRDTCLQEAALTGQFSRRSDFTSTDIFGLPDWQRRLRENTLGSARPHAPVLLTHARSDEALPFGAAEALAGKWCALGADVEFRELLGQEHFVAGAENVGVAGDWLARRFAGAPTDGCNASSPPATAKPAKPRLRVRLVRVRRGRLVVELRPSGARFTRVRVKVAQRGRRIARSRRLTVSQTRRVTLRIRRSAKARRRARIVVTGRAGTRKVRTSVRLRLPARAVPR